MRLFLVAGTVLLGGRAGTAEMSARAPDRIYHSANSRSAVAECLLNRVSESGLAPERTVGDGVTTVAFTSADALVRPKPAVYVFTIRDTATGSVIEMRRLGKAQLATAETCF
jgi:hypothetical protein